MAPLHTVPRMSFMGKGITIAAVITLLVFGRLYASGAIGATRGLGMARGEMATVTFPEAGYTVRAEVARTLAERRQGLSGREGLAEGTGVLFVFPMLDQHRIWMKDMRFSIDIVWIAGGVIVDTHEHLPVPPPGADPASLPYFNPRPQALLALELPAGTVAAHGLIHGRQVRIEFDE